MVAELKYLESHEDADLRTFVPQEHDNFCLSISIYAGPMNSSGEESFDFDLLTPKWLLHNMSTEFLVGRHIVIVNGYNFEGLNHFLRNYISKCDGNSWDEVANKIGRLGRWEFEDYRPSK
jgi:hypothetical protein